MNVRRWVSQLCLSHSLDIIYRSGGEKMTLAEFAETLDGRDDLLPAVFHKKDMSLRYKIDNHLSGPIFSMNPIKPFFVTQGESGEEIFAEVNTGEVFD